MADCNDLFQKFLSEITITSTKSENLRRGKDAIEKKIKNYFSETLEYKQPDFFLQGSYALKTLVNPPNPEDEYDLDDGVHLTHLDGQAEWPDPKEVGNWIKKAVEGHAEQTHVKPNCIRVAYANDYHIDLPVYCEKNGSIYLARIEKNEWLESDPKKFKQWFYERLEKSEQMRSAIKYLKAWKDFCGYEIKGIHLTVLAGLNYMPIQDRDDESLLRTVGNIVAYLRMNRAIWNPIAPENFLAHRSDAEITETINAFENLCAKALEAVNEKDKGKASKKWIALFGPRFPEFSEDKNENKIVFPPLIRKPVAPARPWSQY